MWSKSFILQIKKSTERGKKREAQEIKVTPPHPQESSRMFSRCRRILTEFVAPLHHPVALPFTSAAFDQHKRQTQTKTISYEIIEESINGMDDK